MIIVVETLKAVPGKWEELKKALLKIVPISRKTKGCLQYDLLEPVSKKDEFLILMCWKTLEDLRGHEASNYITEFIQKYDKVLYDEVTVTEWKLLVEMEK